jgi:hypothetical protein
MAETANIARMAEILSAEIFGEFLWQRTGPANANWLCLKEDHGRKTHPSDVVFYYDNPYSKSRTYVNCDLKSYARGSIKSGSIASAIESLGSALYCAEQSEEWQKMYTHANWQADICGLLFVYNHDGEYDRTFAELLTGVKPKNLETPARSKIVILGPDDIRWLTNVSHEILQMRGKGDLPARNYCRFYYPHLIRRKNVQIEKARAATLEMLTGPWVFLSYLNPRKAHQKEYVIFYRRKGGTAQEFLYLIDYLMHYQVLVEPTKVLIKILDPDLMAPAVFKKALEQYLEECEESVEIKERLETIEYSSITQVQTKFYEIEIGMNNGQ